MGKIEDVRFSERAEELIALQLGNTDEWRLRTADVAHPFHIHINPFQVVRVTRLADGVDMTGDATSQYFGMKDVYKDTIIVEPGVEVVVRSHYERYVGRFVLHCHILPHEDGGMMRLVEIFEAGIPGGLDFIEQHGKGAGGRGQRIGEPGACALSGGLQRPASTTGAVVIRSSAWHACAHVQWKRCDRSAGCYRARTHVT